MSHPYRIPLAICLALLASGAAVAAPAPTPAQRIDTLEQRVARDQQMIEQLAAQLHALQAQLAQQQATPPASTAPAAPAATPAAPGDGERLASVERQLQQMTDAANAGRSEDRGLPVHGFIDVGAGNHNPLSPEVKGAYVGSVDFYLAPQLGEHTRGLVELNFEVSEEGTVGVDLERTQLGYQVGNAGTFWLGRFHTPYGYWNTAFHHGQQIATSLRRPRFLAFEDQGGILPAHSTGLWFTGAQRLGEGRLGYDAYVTNAQHVDAGVLDMRQAGGSGQAGFGGRLSWQPGSPEALQVGASLYTARIDDTASAANDTRLNVLGLHAAWDGDALEGLAELYLFRNEAISGGTHSSHAGYAQLGWRLGAWTPYVRYERTSLDQSDGYFAAQASGGSYHREALGLRRDLDLKSALKLELADTHMTDGTPARPLDDYADVLLQYAVRF